MRRPASGALRLTLAALLVASSAQAHDFWLLPERFRLPDDAEAPVLFRIGHGVEVEPWNLRWERVVALRSHGPRGIADQQATITPRVGEAIGGARPALAGSGTHILAFESHHSFSELEAARFEDYAKKEGLAAVLAERIRAKSGDKPGRELYSRRAKALVQLVGAPTDNVLAPIGHTLEIVPERHPYRLGEDRRLPVRVLFRGRPLPGATVDITDLDAGAEPAQTAITDAEGRAAFTVPERGAWKVNVIWGVPNPASERAEFETVFASLTFGYR